MKNIIKMVLVLSISFGFSFAENNSFKIYKLKKKLLRVENQINEILINKEQTSEILSKYSIKAEKHLAVVTSFMTNKEKCQKLENFYKEQQSKESLDKRVLKKQARNIVDCYEKLEKSTYEFEDKSKEFLKLKKNINVLRDMLEADKSLLVPLEQQRYILKKLIKMISKSTKNNELNAKDVNKLIDEL